MAWEYRSFISIFACSSNRSKFRVEVLDGGKPEQYRQGLFAEPRTFDAIVAATLLFRVQLAHLASP
ncbi:MAG: hypothetical protein JWO91_2436 [Acidobacteriaceae bacterium]|nr:hypothetical protein [Acidobacteriaceae bacterium]